MNGPDDPLSRLGGSLPGGEDFLASLPSRLAERLGGEAPALRHDDDRTAWLVLDGTDVVRFDPEVAAIYFIDAVPFRVRLVDLAAVGGFALAANFLACWLPSARASRIVPSVALRYE